MDIADILSQTILNTTREISTGIKGVSIRFIKIIDEKMELKKNIESYIAILKKWTNIVNFQELSHSKKLQSIYIQLDTFIYPKYKRIDENEETKKIKLIEVIEKENNHMLILGQPGSGKTTSMKYICKKLLETTTFERIKKIPVVLIVREIISETDIGYEWIKDVLFNEIALKFGFYTNESIIKRMLKDTNDKDKNTNQSNFEELLKWRNEYQKSICKYLDSFASYLIIEGIDEASSENLKVQIYNNIRIFAKYLEKCKLIATTRTGEVLYCIDNVEEYEIAPLDYIQIEEFIKKWFADSKDREILFNQLKKSPYYDATMKPLNLAHLCAIYERYGSIPEKPRTVYRKLINLLLEDWDQQRSIKRCSKYATFEIDRKFEFLCNIAYKISVDIRKPIFSDEDLKLIYQHIYQNYNLPEGQVKQVVEEIENHTGIITRTGNLIYSFEHKSMQEYLSAEYIIRLPEMSYFDGCIDILGNELAIAVSLSSNQNLYFSTLVNKHIIKRVKTISFLTVFVNRLFMEKPDIYISLDASIAFLNLYSHYLFLKSSVSNKYIVDIVSEAEFKDYEHFFYSIIQKRNFRNVLQEYEVLEKIVESSDPVLILKCKNKNELPGKLFCRDSFISRK